MDRESERIGLQGCQSGSLGMTGEVLGMSEWRPLDDIGWAFSCLVMYLRNTADFPSMPYSVIPGAPPCRPFLSSKTPTPLFWKPALYS